MGDEAGYGLVCELAYDAGPFDPGGLRLAACTKPSAVGAVYVLQVDGPTGVLIEEKDDSTFSPFPRRHDYGVFGLSWVSAA
jgi:hypothetical protein